jgi:hypothetical protein
LLLSTSLAFHLATKLSTGRLPREDEEVVGEAEAEDDQLDDLKQEVQTGRKRTTSSAVAVNAAALLPEEEAERLRLAAVVGLPHPDECLCPEAPIQRRRAWIGLPTPIGAGLYNLGIRY